MGKERGKDTKKGWKQAKKGGEEDGLKEVHAQREMEAKMDAELFSIDVKRTEEEGEGHFMKLTHRQKRALEHRSRMQRLENQLGQDSSEMKGEATELMDIDESKTEMKVKIVAKIPARKGRRINHRRQPYDIWEDEEQNVDGKRRKRTAYVPSGLPAVVPPQEGASYNPPFDSYLKMAEQMANEEQAIESKERRTERRIGISEAEAATCQGIRVDVECFDEKREMNEETIVEEKDPNSINDGKTKEKRSKSAKEKKRQKMRRAEAKKAMLEKKMGGQKKQQLQNLKTLKRQVNENLKKQEERISRRRGEKLEKELTRRKRLGRGKFEPFEEPLLLMDELPSKLRQLCPQGNILQERMKSLQQRNILPIAGERAAKLKARLKAKLVEKRSVKEVTEHSRVI